MTGNLSTEIHMRARFIYARSRYKLINNIVAFYVKFISRPYTPHEVRVSLFNFTNLQLNIFVFIGEKLVPERLLSMSVRVIVQG